MRNWGIQPTIHQALKEPLVENYREQYKLPPSHTTFHIPVCKHCWEKIIENECKKKNSPWPRKLYNYKCLHKPWTLKEPTHE